jgi:hypothetical protein
MIPRRANSFSRLCYRVGRQSDNTMHICLKRIGCLFACLLVPASIAIAQDQAAPGVAVPESERLRVNVRFMAGYGVDESHYDIGNESHGRVGYAIVELSGRISERFSYRFDFNPVHETQPQPACGEEDFFYPNVPQAFGPTVVCDPDGRMRVDDYRFVALDLLHQQGPIRQAFVAYRSAGGLVGGQFGRFVLPIGFGWEEAGSFTAKDATHIQRINAEANFGLMLAFNWPAVTLNAAAFIGDGNRFHDYDYFYSLDSTFDTNSAITSLASATFRLAPALDVRLAQKAGFSGSKVERLPNFYASKRVDRSTVASLRYRPVPFASVFGEFAWYTWGLTRTSAELLAQPDTTPVQKKGYYIGGDANVPLTSAIRLGTTITREELDRDDALIKFLALQDLYGVALGETERSTVYRFYLDLGDRVRAGLYFTRLDNPFPWVSGIAPVSGPRAFEHRGDNKWGLAARFSLD